MISLRIGAMKLHFRKLTVWHRAMEFAEEVYRLARFLPREETFGVRLQLTRSATSVAANIAEGWTREHPKEKGQFLAVAQGSLAEAETYLELCTRLTWIPAGELVLSLEQAVELNKMLTTMRRKTREISSRKAPQAD